MKRKRTKKVYDSLTRRSTRVSRTSIGSTATAASSSRRKKRPSTALIHNDQPARKWAQVLRPPTHGVGFKTMKWIPIDDLTEDERTKYNENEEVKRKRREFDRVKTSKHEINQGEASKSTEKVALPQNSQSQAVENASSTKEENAKEKDEGPSPSESTKTDEPNVTKTKVVDQNQLENSTKQETLDNTNNIKNEAQNEEGRTSNLDAKAESLPCESGKQIVNTTKLEDPSVLNNETPNDKIPESNEATETVKPEEIPGKMA